MKKEKKKILITIDWFLPGTLSGGPVRSYANLIEYLKDDFDFYIITRNTDYGSNVAYENIVPNTWVKLNNYTQVFYISNSELSKSFIKKTIADLDFDTAFINGIYSWYFSIIPIFILKKINKPIIISARGMLNSQAFSVKKRKKKLYLLIAKLLGVYKNIKFHATNIEEAQSIRNEIGSKSIVMVAPNLPRKLERTEDLEKSKSEPVRFVNIARIAIEKGTITILKALLKVKQSIELDLYGPIYDKAYWADCKNVILDLPNNIKVNYKGVVDSEDVPSVLNSYDFFILLSEGENFGHSILEALSAGLPVLISNKTPWKNLEEKQVGWDVSTVKEIQILKALNDAIEMSKDEYFIWSNSAFHYAKAFIENPQLLEQNKALFLNPNYK